ncbi:O-antigen ligase [Halomonas sp. HAL1]|uniref:O-antigen ligase family protein n=1 Tax=Halomonas sp. HAL1 TaxID=550984 RepID=UPI00022D2A19|nr:O-antigen ligase family protein [Halomonas sp. HAL1]EHA14327.1 hypothetical protein HAL1_18101 [Halomonas sp. HAL1]WKV92414.1 hypothetical protein Q3Y66_16420 [Halomonas sp. HAL1]
MRLDRRFDNLLSSSFYTNLYALLLSLGPVYWLPGVSPALLLILKSFLFVVLITISVSALVVKKRFLFCGGKPVFIIFSFFCLASIPAIIFGEFSQSVYHVQNSLQIFLFVAATSVLIEYGRVLVVARRAVFLFFLFSSLSIVMMLLFPDYPNPLNQQLSVANTGLGGSRTGWSPAVALFMPWAYSLGYSSLFMSVLQVFVFASNQIITVGRTGILASLVPLFVLGALSKRIKVFLAVSFSLVILIIYAVYNLDDLRLNQGGFDSLESVNELSTGRVDDYVVAGKIIMQSPLTGQGFNLLVNAGEGAYPHNVFILLTAQGGILLGGSAFILVCLGLLSGLRKFRSSPIKQASFLTLLAGFVVAMLEPKFIFGNFNNSVFWWFCFCLCASKRV